MATKLRILVPIKRVIDYAVKPRINKQGTGVETQGVKFSINPFDDIAVEEAVRLRERYKEAVEEIHAVSIGPSKVQDVLRVALAKGVDSSTLIDTTSNGHAQDGEHSLLEPLGVAKILKSVVEENKSNLVILGKQAIDDDANQTGQILAGLLSWPQMTFASSVKVDGDIVTVSREIDGGEEIIKAKLPLVITTDLRLNEPRYASLPNIMKAKKKPLKIVKGTTIESPRIDILSVVQPEPRKGGGKVASVDELIAKLNERGLLNQ